jgi:hypothetical protein
MESKKEKFRRTLLDLADSGKYIPGIYNYCDRWCERCSFSCKCLTHAHEQEMKEESNIPESDCIDNEKFWEQIRLSFEVTLDLISEDAKRLGIDLTNLPDVEEPLHHASPAEILAGEYGTAMGNWLKENNEKLEARGNQLLTIYNKKEPALKFTDALEVVQWYCYFISAKIHRAYFELDSRLEEDEDDLDLISDNTGSAKVALIAITRSIEALTVLYPEMKDQEDDILKFLGQLTKIKNMLIATFPSAMEFKRPGFDD